MLAENTPGSLEHDVGDHHGTVRQVAETRLWLQILNVHRIIYADLNTALGERFGLSVPKFDVLSHLYRYPDGLAMGELSRKLKVSNGNVSGLISRLRNDGFIQKEMTKADRRSFRARLTERGRIVFEEALDVHRDVVSKAMASASSAQIDSLTDGLKALIRKSAAEPQASGNPDVIRN